MLAGAAAGMLALAAVVAGLWAVGVIGPRDDGKGDRTAQVTEKLKGPADDKAAGKKLDVVPKPEKKEPPEEKRPALKEPPKELTNTVGMKLVRLEGGKFFMGSTKAEQDDAIADYEKIVGSKASEGTINIYRTEGPRHEVELTRPFYLGKYEVTQGQYERVMGRNPSWFSKQGGGRDRVAGMATDDFPVENVSWDEAAELCKRLTQKERKEGKIGGEQEYRLSTEAEWEYSCRGGAVSKHFHFGDSLSSKQANFDGDYPYGGAAKGDWLWRTAKVGSYEANEYGLFDMHGNVWERCLDAYDKDAYKGGPRRDPLVLPKEQSSGRVIRGGSWFDFGRRCRSALRGRDSPGDRIANLGFRVALVSPVGQ